MWIPRPCRAYLLVAALCPASVRAAEAEPPSVSRHVAAAQSAAGSQWENLFNLLCAPPAPAAPATPAPATPAAPPAPAPPGPPELASWYAEPVRVFDNLYYVGMTEYSAWAVTTSAGIILVDTLYDYAVQALALKANEIDAHWFRYRDGCLRSSSTNADIDRNMFGSNRDRQWYGLFNGDVRTPADDNCRQLMIEMTRMANDWRNNMSRIEDTARANDVLPGAMREIRQRYRVDF